uniref:Extended synaptotagmin-like protein 1b n=1 Tax=Cyprinus carpio carpio TaxID=630221 RepID=A0A9J8DCY8_CYPCA
MSHVDSGPKNDSDTEKKTEPAQDTSSGDMDVPKTKLLDAKAILWTFGKCLTAFLPVYLAGYYRVSTSLVVFGMMVYAGWKHTREAKEARLKSAVQLVNDEQEYISSKSFRSRRDLPSWVNFPDVEKVEWLNKVIQQAWPYIGQYLEKLLTETIAPSIRGSSSHLQTLSFTKVDFGGKPMKVVGVKAHAENEKGQILLDVYISYVGDVEINVEVKRYFCKAGVKGIQLHGMMRVILEPLIGDVPIVGAVTMFFIQRPKLTINWTGLTNLLDIPGLNVMSDTMIMDTIASFLVLPNRLTVPLVANLHVAQLRCPLPRGVVRIHLVEADDLASKDNTVMAGMSDPYALLRVGPQTFKSRHLDNTLSPKWDEMYEVIVHEVPGQELEVEVFDKDPDHDDFLGRTKLDLGIVKKSKIVDEWFTLKDTPTGRVHLRLEWLKLETDTERLEEVLKRNESVVSKTAKPPSSAILAVYLDKAEALPMKKGNKDPNPIVQIAVQDVTRDSRICWNTVNPQWEDAFTFFIRDPSKQDINIQVKDNDRVQVLGSLSIPVSRLLSCQDLNLDEWFNLENSGPESRIHINTVLRVLWLDEAAAAASLLSSDPLSKSSASRPQKTTPHSSFATEGMLRIHLVEGQNLVAKDNLMGGMVKGKSDPYVKIQVGGETFKSQVIKENLNPVWNEMYEVVLTQLPGQELTLEVFDRDMDMKDDFMGRLKMNLSDIIDSEYINEWFTLSDVKRGRVHVALEWLPTVTQPEKLQQVLEYQSKSSYLNKKVPTAALLFVYLERAHELPLKKSGKEPKVGAELILRGASHKTTVSDRTSCPQWDEAFHFLVRDPLNEDLVVKLSHNWDFSLGSVVIPIKELLSEPDLMLDQWLDLDGASPQSQILLRAQLKILCPKETESSEDHEEPKHPKASSFRRKPEEELVQKSSIEEVPPSPVSRTSSVSVPEEEEVPEVTEVPEVSNSDDLRPLHTSPDPSFGAEGVLRLHLLEAEDLVAKDKMMGGMVKGKSDPYVKIHIGDKIFKSHVIKENLNPTWNEMYELVLTSRSTSDVLVEVFDKDMDKDDFLGRVKISLQEIIQSQLTDEWFSLNDVKHGRVHMILEWLPTVTQPDRLQKALQLQSEHSYQNKSVPSAALFFILLERAHDLPLKKSGKEPRAAAELVLGEISYKTKVCERSTSPEWSEAFDFLLHNPTEEILIIKLSSAFEQPLGSVVLPIRELLSKPDLLMDQWLSLDGAGPDSQILLRAQLKILDSSLDTSVLHRKKPVVEEEHSVGEQHKEKAPVTVELSQAAVSKESEKKTLPTKGVSELAASTLLLPEEHQKQTDNRDIDVHLTPSVPKTQPATEDLSKVPDSTPSEGGYMEPVKTFGSAHEEQKPEEQSHKKVSPSAPAEETKVSSSTDVRPQKTCHDPSFGTKGVLRIHLLEAQDLVAKDNMMGGMMKGKSDPYVKIHIGDTTFKSHVIKENLNPTWNEMYELVLTSRSTSDVLVEVFDKDMDKDDFLGRVKISLQEIIQSQLTDEWFSLNDIKHGRVHMILEWLPTVTQPDRLQKALQLQSEHSYQNKSVPSAALFFILLERAHDLPLKKSGKEPRAAAELVLGDVSYKTKVCERSMSPEWSEAFDFLLHNPTEEILIIKLSSAFEQPLGSVVLPIRELLSKPDLLMDQWLSLDGAGPDSQILLRAQLKILDSSLDASVLHRKKPVVEEEHSVGEQHKEKAPVTVELSQAAVSKESEKKTLPTKGVSELAASTLLLPEEHQKQTDNRDIDVHLMPSVPKTQPAAEDLSKVPDSTPSEGGYMEPVKTFGSAHEEQKPEEQSHKKVSPSAPAEESKVSSSIDVRPQKTRHDPSFGTKGVLRIHLLEARDLVAKDNMMGGMMKGKSDPYVKIHIGDTTFKSHVIKENLNPTWNEMYELVLTSRSTSDVLVEVFDKDMDKDDFLGRVKISLQEIIQSQLTDEWFSLNDIKHGRVHMILEWLPTVTQPDRLQKALQLQSEHSYQNKSVPSAALFFILLERAHDLPLKKSGKEPRAAAELVLGDVSYKTKVCERSTSPEWSEAFDFLLHNPTEEILIIKLSSAFEQPLGSVVLPIRELLSKPDLLMDQWLSLDGAGPDSQILLRAQLKILDSSLDTSVLHRKKPVVEEEHSVGEQHKEKAPVTVELSQAAVSKESEKKTLPTKGVSELAASTLLLPEEHQKQTDNRDIDVHLMPSVPKTQPATEDLSKVPDSTPSEGGYMEPVKTFGSAHEEQKPEEQSHKKVSPSAPAEETKVSSSTDVRPQKTCHDPSFGTKGVLRIHLLEAQDLVAKDNMMGGMMKGKSDPYVKIHIGDTTFKSHVIKENLNPTWNEMYEMILSPDHNLDVKFELYDKDFESDDFLGRFKLKLGHIISSQYNDEWFTLKDIKHGRVHLVLEWLPTSTQRDRLDQVMHMQSSQTYQNKSVPSAALLFIHLERAHDLPLKKSGKEPKAAAELILGGTTYKTKVCDRSSSPYWNEAFDFLVHDPKKDILIIKLSSAWDQPMGSLVLPIRELLSKPDLLMDQWLNLDGASPKSQVLLRAQLKILDSKMAALVAMGSGPVLSNKQTAKTGQIKLSLSFQKKLTVTIHACRGLVTSSKDSLDTYVSLILLPDKSKATKRKTTVKKKNLNPEFNERFEFDMSVEDAQRRELSVSVKNASSSFMTRDKDVIGQVQIELGHVDLVSGVTEWFDLKEE